MIRNSQHPCLAWILITLILALPAFSSRSNAQPTSDTFASSLKQAVDEAWRSRAGFSPRLYDFDSIEPLFAPPPDLATPEAVPFLLDVLKNGPDWLSANTQNELHRYTVRCYAALCLGTTGDERAFTPLAEALQEPTPPFLQNTHGRYDLAMYAAAALGYMNRPEALDPLVAALQNENRHVVTVIAVALAHLGDPRAVLPILNAIHPDDKMEVHTFHAALKHLTHADFGFEFSVDNQTVTATEFPEFGQMPAGDIPFKRLWQKYLVVAPARERRRVQDLYSQLEQLRAERPNETEAQQACLWEFSELSIAALPPLTALMQRQAREVIPAISEISHGQLDKTATCEECDAWWIKTFQRWRAPFVRTPKHYAVVTLAWEKVLARSGDGEWDVNIPIPAKDCDCAPEGRRGDAVDNQGRIFIADSYNDRILVFTSEGERLTIINLADRLAFPCEIYVDEADTLYVSGVTPKERNDTQLLLKPTESGWEVLPFDPESLSLAPGAQLTSILDQRRLVPLGFRGLRALRVEMGGEYGFQAVDHEGYAAGFVPTIYRDCNGWFYDVIDQSRLRLYNPSGELVLETETPSGPASALPYRGWLYVHCGNHRLYRFAEDGTLEEEISADAPYPKDLYWPLMASPRADFLYSRRETDRDASAAITLWKWDYKQVASKPGK